MEKTNVLTLIITLVVGVILTGALLGPVISDAVETESTFENDGLFYMTKYSASDSIPTVVWDSANPHNVTVGEDVVGLSENNTPIAWSYIFADTWAVRYLVDNNGTYAQYFGEGSGVLLGASTSDNNTLTVSFSEGTATLTNGTTTKTASYEDIFVISSEGNYVMKNSSEAAKVLVNTDVYVVGRTILTFTSSTPLNIHFMGSIGGGFGDSEVIYPTSGYELSDFTVNAEVVNGYIDLYSLENVSFNITETSSEIQKTATYSQFVVPTEVTAEHSSHLTPGQISLMGAIPIMVIVALLITAVGAIALRRND